jgi:homospermidine synthase
VAGGWPRIPFGGRLLLVGCGSVSRCLQPLLLRHLEMDLTRLTVLDFDERRSLDPDLIAAGTLIPHQNATTLQVAASVLGALAWMRDPDRGYSVPNDLDHCQVLEVAGPNLGPCPSLPTGWTPLHRCGDPFQQVNGIRPRDEGIWQLARHTEAPHV